VLTNLAINFAGIFYQVFQFLRLVYRKLKAIYSRIESTMEKVDGGLRTIKLRPEIVGEGACFTFEP